MPRATRTTVVRALVPLLAAWAGALATNRSLRRVRGHSMAPTLQPGDLLLTIPRFGHPRRGDVVLLRDPRDEQRATVKRVVGLPGEEVAIRRGRLTVDGRGYRESYEAGAGPDGSLTVPPGHVAVLGDARGRSTDSRTYGAVPLDLVERRCLARVAPRPRLLTDRPRRLVLAAAPQDGRRSA